MSGENQQEIFPGMTLGGRYQIDGLIGRGGMALVYKAKDSKTGNDVAIKVLKHDLSTDEEFVRRFDTEAQAASSLSHPNIVKVLGVGEEHGIRYMVQEYVDGTTLKELIDSYGRLDWRVAVPIGLQIALALESAHEAGVVHRDIKPQNIMITPDRTALVTDFGIARASTANTITLTSGSAMGSVHYFSPEQARGGMVGPASDIYSLGILFYEMLTGDVPFDGESSVAVALKHLQEEPQDPRNIVPDLPAGLAAIVMKCIQKNPRQRYHSAREMIDELDSFMLDPDGNYGYVDPDSHRYSATTTNGSLRPESDFEKIHIIEESIHSRRRSRQRENGIIIALVLVFFALLISIGAFVASRLSADPIASQSEIGDYVVQNFVGMTKDQAVALLDEEGIEYDLQERASAEVPANQVMEQTPAEGIVISRSGLQDIVLVISTGDGSLRLGDYEGMNYLAAEIELRSQLGYEVVVVRETSEEHEKDTVIRTEPAAGEIVPADQPVRLIVSSGSAEFQIPYTLIGRARELVLQDLEALELEVGDITVAGPDPRLPSTDQYLIAMTPPPGTTVNKGDRIDLVFSDYAYLNPSPTPEPTETPSETTEEDPTTETEPSTSETTETSTSESTASEPPATTPSEGTTSGSTLTVTTPPSATESATPATTAPPATTPPTTTAPTTTAAPAPATPGNGTPPVNPPGLNQP